MVGIDQSADMVRHTRTRLGPHVEVRQHDLNAPVAWASDARFDIVLLALVVHYVENRVRTLTEFARVLRPAGRIIVSTSHPTADWLADGGSYFDARRAEEAWSNGMTHRYWRQPLQAWVTEFSAADLTIDRLVEHRPAASMPHQHPAAYEKLKRQPDSSPSSLLGPRPGPSPDQTPTYQLTHRELSECQHGRPSRWSAVHPPPERPPSRAASPSNSAAPRSSATRSSRAWS
ncbi:methyltransferase domain-containing protein [Streptomyces vinaceus]